MKNIENLERIKLARETTDITIMSELSHCSDIEVRYQLARNPFLDRKTFELLSKDPDSSVRYSICFNPSVPEDIVDCLYEDDCWIVKYAALSHMISTRNLVTSEKAKVMEELRTLILANQ